MGPDKGIVSFSYRRRLESSPWIPSMLFLRPMGYRKGDTFCSENKKSLLNEHRFAMNDGFQRNILVAMVAFWRRTHLRIFGGIGSWCDTLYNDPYTLFSIWYDILAGPPIQQIHPLHHLNEVTHL